MAPNGTRRVVLGATVGGLALRPALGRADDTATGPLQGRLVPAIRRGMMPQ